MAMGSSFAWPSVMVQRGLKYDWIQLALPLCLLLKLLSKS